MLLLVYKRTASTKCTTTRTSTTTTTMDVLGRHRTDDIDDDADHDGDFNMFSWGLSLFLSVRFECMRVPRTTSVAH